VRAPVGCVEQAPERYRDLADRHDVLERFDKHAYRPRLLKHQPLSVDGSAQFASAHRQEYLLAEHAPFDGNAFAL
jgi:hypothetical protein